MTKEMAKKLADAWRAKGLMVTSMTPGLAGELVKAAFDTCAEDLEEWTRDPEDWEETKPIPNGGPL
jgi:hypothetical protein